MSKKKPQKDKTFENTVNQQQQLSNSVAADPLGDSGANQPHNTKKQALGPNTKRK